MIQSDILRLSKYTRNGCRLVTRGIAKYMWQVERLEDQRCAPIDFSGIGLHELNYPARLSKQ